MFVGCENSCIICKLEPKNGFEKVIQFIVGRETKLLILFLANVMYESINTDVEKQRTKAVALKNTLSNRNSRSKIIIRYDRRVKISIEARNQ